MSQTLLRPTTAELIEAAEKGGFTHAFRSRHRVYLFAGQIELDSFAERWAVNFGTNDNGDLKRAGAYGKLSQGYQNAHLFTGNYPPVNDLILKTLQHG